MQQVAGYYFQQNFSHTFNEMRSTEESEEIYSNLSNNITGFKQFINNLSIECLLKKPLKVESFSSLKHLMLHGNFSSTQLLYVKDILGIVEDLDLVDIQISNRLYKQMINYCTKLKCLRVECSSFLRREITYNWLQTNPTVEYLQLDTHDGDIDKNRKYLTSLLEHNPNLRHFKVRAEIFWANRNSLAEANIQLDSLGIAFNIPPSREFADLLIKLDKRGFF